MKEIRHTRHIMGVFFSASSELLTTLSMYGIFLEWVLA